MAVLVLNLILYVIGLGIFYAVTRSAVLSALEEFEYNKALKRKEALKNMSEDEHWDS